MHVCSPHRLSALLEAAIEIEDLYSTFAILSIGYSSYRAWLAQATVWLDNDPASDSNDSSCSSCCKQ